MSKNVAIFLAYFSLLIFLLVILAIIFVPFVNQIGGLFEVLPDWISKLLNSINGLNINGFKIDSASVEKSVSDWVSSLTTSGQFQKYNFNSWWVLQWIYYPAFSYSSFYLFSFRA